MGYRPNPQTTLRVYAEPLSLLAPLENLARQDIIVVDRTRYSSQDAEGEAARGEPGYICGEIIHPRKGLLTDFVLMEYKSRSGKGEHHLCRLNPNEELEFSGSLGRLMDFVESSSSEVGPEARHVASWYNSLVGLLKNTKSRNGDLESLYDQYSDLFEPGEKRAQAFSSPHYMAARQLARGEGHVAIVLNNRFRN